jgi:hypothetical protein
LLTGPLFPIQAASTPIDADSEIASELDGQSIDAGNGKRKLDNREHGNGNGFHASKRLNLSDDDGIEEINRLPENWHHEETI